MTEPYNPWDKVKLTAMIASLESQLSFEKVAKEQAQKHAEVTAKALKKLSASQFKAMNFPLEKIRPLVQSVRAWVPENRREWFDGLVSDPDFERALGMGVRALMLEVLGETRDA